jgi:hypothetical protein
MTKSRSLYVAQAFRPAALQTFKSGRVADLKVCATYIWKAL